MTNEIFSDTKVIFAQCRRQTSSSVRQACFSSVVMHLSDISYLAASNCAAALKTRRATSSGPRSRVRLCMGTSSAIVTPDGSRARISAMLMSPCPGGKRSARAVCSSCSVVKDRPAFGSQTWTMGSRSRAIAAMSSSLLSERAKCSVSTRTPVLFRSAASTTLLAAHVRHERPRKELKQHRKIVAARKIGKRSEPLGKSSKVGVVRRCNDVSRAQFCPRCRKWLQRRDVDLRRNLDELDVTDP
jgi:hypothetical protein